MLQVQADGVRIHHSCARSLNHADRRLSPVRAGVEYQHGVGQGVSDIDLIANRIVSDPVDRS